MNENCQATFYDTKSGVLILRVYLILGKVVLKSLRPSDEMFRNKAWEVPCFSGPIAFHLSYIETEKISIYTSSPDVNLEDLSRGFELEFGKNRNS